MADGKNPEEMILTIGAPVELICASKDFSVVWCAKFSDEIFRDSPASHLNNDFTHLLAREFGDCVDGYLDLFPSGYHFDGHPLPLSLPDSVNDCARTAREHSSRALDLIRSATYDKSWKYGCTLEPG